MKTADLRVAFVTGTLQLGGSTTFLLNLAGELIKRGVSCKIFSGDNLHPLARDFERSRIPVSLHDHRHTIFEDRVAAVMRELRDYKPNVVVATLGPFAFETLRYVPPNLSRVGMVQSDDPAVYEMAEKYADCMDRIVGVSTVIVRRLGQIEVFRAIAKQYLPYGIAIPDQAAPPDRQGEPLRILYLGRLNNEQKRVYLLPQIAADLEKAGTNFEWTIVGDGPDRIDLMAKMKASASSDRVKFPGTVNYGDIATLLGSHDIFVLVSDYEGLPLSLLEAMGHGLVPVVSDLESGIREVVNESNGALVPVADTSGYAKAIIRLDQDRAELARESAAARERVRTEFSVEAMTDRWLDFLASAPNQTIEWSGNWRIRAPFGASSNLVFTKPFQILRRLRKRLVKGP